MDRVNLINKFGLMAGWNAITVNLLGRDVEGITELSYDDNVEIEGAPGAGMFFVGYSKGKYVAKCSITLYTEEWNAIQAALPLGSHVSDIKPFPIIVEYEYDLRKVTDIIPACMIPGRGVAVKQGDKTIAYKCDLFVGGKIETND